MTKKGKTKVVWLSANLLGYKLLEEALKIKEIEIVGIITLSNKAKTKMYDGIDKQKWYSFGIPVYEIENINEETKSLKLFNPDFVMMCGWRQLIDRKILNIPTKGFISFHPALLPKGRGPAPVINTILGGWKESGVTIYYVDDTLDGGDIIGQKKFKIQENDYAADLYKKIIKAGKYLVKKYLPLLRNNKASRVPQDDKKATYFPKRNMKDNEINIDKEDLETIYRKIRAFSKPYNGAYIKLKDKKLIIWKAELKNEKKS